MELSPQYVPAEKFEEERRALYASLLKPDSPVVSDNSVTVENTVSLNDSTESRMPEPEDPSDLIVKETEENALNRSVEDAMAQLHGDEAVNSNELDENNAVSEKLVTQQNTTLMLIKPKWFDFIG